jgi:deoxyinosine 3'endonuclease (endonuclease V)
LTVNLRESLGDPGSEQAAEELQRKLARRVKLRPLGSEVRKVAGAVVREVGGRRWACAARS